MQEPGFGYVVIGAGSAGCIAAARLADSQPATVLLLEAGDPAERNPECLSADGFKDAFANDALMWHRMTARQSTCGGRTLYAGTGRGMGGSGSVNGMVYTRGDRRDFDAWPSGWRWDDVAPAFESVEHETGIRPRAATPFAERFIAAARSAGLKRKDGMNDGDLRGVVGCNAMNYAGEERRSSYRTWLHGKARPNLEVITGARAHRIVFEDVGGADNPAGNRGHGPLSQAIAVEFETGGEVRRVRVDREVIVCAGALETPKLLMLSGIGPRAQLESLGIAVVHDAPGVGSNLQDHPNVCLFYRARHDVDFRYPQVYGFDAARGDAPADAAPDSCFVCYAAPASIKESMLRMLPILALPGRLHDVALLRRMLRGMIHAAFAVPLLRRFVSRVFGIVVILGKPTSRGEVRLASSDPSVPAIVDPNYFATAADRETLLAAIGKARDFAAQPALAGAKPLSAGAATDAAARVWKWVVAATMTTFHFCGTCRMGDDDASPVDGELRLKGTRNVRIADASVIPEIPVSALNAPSMMIGWRAADFVLRGASP